MSYQRAIVDTYTATVEFDSRMVVYSKWDCNGWENLLTWIQKHAVDQYHTEAGTEYVTDTRYWSEDVIEWMRQEAEYRAREWRRWLCR